MFTFGFWFYHELQPFIGQAGVKNTLNKDGYLRLSTPNGIVEVKSNSFRLELLHRSPYCVHCGKEGVIWMAQNHHHNEPKHLNLYALTDQVKDWKKITSNGLVMMTKDHIVPRSAGGSTELDNLQILCEVCNAKKGSTLSFQAEQKMKTDPKYRLEIVKGDLGKYRFPLEKIWY